MIPYYDDGTVQIFHGDCREVLPDIQADVVITDPPFSVPIKYEATGGNVHPRSWGDLVVMEPFFREVFTQIERAAGDGQVYVHCDGDTYPVFYKVAYSIWPQSHLLVWYKPTGRRGRGWLHSHELILHLRKPTTKYAEGWRQDLIGIMPVRTLKREHPAEKPGDLVSFLLEGALPNQTVLDPFTGAGTTLCVAKQLGHRAIGIEIEERYCEIAARRLEQAVLPLEGVG